MTKPAKPATTNVVEDALNAAQVVLTMNPAIGPQTTHFWTAQGHIMKEAENFSTAWLKRHQAATRATLDTASQVAFDGMKNPAAAIEAVMDWHKQAVARLADDARACTDMMMRCANTAVSNEIEAADETARIIKRATTHTAIPV